MNRGERLPPPVHADLTDTVLDYWMARVAQHEHDWYAGVRLLKFPEDLRSYEHLIWASRASVVIELGARSAAARCGSATACGRCSATD